MIMIVVVIVVVGIIEVFKKILVRTTVTEAITPQRSDAQVAGIVIGPTEPEPVVNAVVVVVWRHDCNASVTYFYL